jgi:adenylyl cyclase-associated protein
VTKGLKKVTADQQTHKNPSLRASGVVPEKAASPPPASPAGRPVKPTKPKTLAAKKPAKMELEGKKWTIVRISLHCR